MNLVISQATWTRKEEYSSHVMSKNDDITALIYDRSHVTKTYISWNIKTASVRFCHQLKPGAVSGAGIYSHFAYVSIHLLSFCLYVSFCLKTCIISPTYEYDLERLSRDKTDWFTLIDNTGWLSSTLKELGRELRGQDWLWQHRMTVG